jgi:hypothetical protein
MKIQLHFSFEKYWMLLFGKVTLFTLHRFFSVNFKQMNNRENREKKTGEPKFCEHE